MPRPLIEVGSEKPLLDIASYARRGPSRRDHLSQDEIELIERTVRRAPEVMVKVLTRGGQNLKAVARHMAYLNRGGDVDIDSDDGQQLSGKGVEKELLEDWDLDLEEHRRTSDLESRSTRTPPKLVHKVMFSMPPGTPPEKVLAAVKVFARDEFALKHRYAMVLHTDAPHPHVHLVVKAVSEQGERLNIRKARLRHWRKEFARHLRAQGIAANSTERATRGVSQTLKPDGIYRASLRGASTHMLERALSLIEKFAKGGRPDTLQNDKLIRTRMEVARGWRAVSAILANQGQADLAAAVDRFLTQMPLPQSDQQVMAREVFGRVHSEQSTDRSEERVL